MGMDSGLEKKRFMSEINVTPLVDVMLVLLIIFMVAAPMMTQGVDVTLPKTTAKQLKTSEEPLILTINKKQEIYIENKLMSLSDLETKVRAIFQNRKDKEILLRADKEVPYGVVMEVVARVKGAGIDKLGMVTEALD